MSIVKIQGHASGTGTLTVTAPNTSTNRTITLPDTTGTLATTNINSFTNDTTITSGDLIFATAGKGVCLGVTTNTDANTLDDYEEGTFSPRLQFDGATTGITYSSGYDTGWYTKIGNLVNFGFTMVLSSKGSATGGAQLSGLPFSLNNIVYQQGTATFMPYKISFADQIMCYLPRNNTVITIVEKNNAGTETNITNSNVENDSQFIIQGAYLSG